MSLARAGQRGRLFFNATASQRISVALTGVTLPQYALLIIKPGGAILGSPTAARSSTSVRMS
jgi:hypothetical protein